jgi:hypothetical protein
MVWAPRCALLPLGSVRGEEGLTVWEFIAFAEACENRYRSGDDEWDADEEARFLFEEAWAAEEQQQEDEMEDNLFGRTTDWEEDHEND